MRREIEIEKDNEKIIANLKLEALRSQMNPHFIFNTLGSIQYYVQTHRIEEADNYLTLFAALIRKYLNSSSEQMISLEEEVSLLEHYVKLEQMRFESLFETEIYVDQSLDVKETLLPSMMVQPFVENALNHGLLHRKDGSACLRVEFKKLNEDIMQIIIQDNGIGREKAKKLSKTGHKSRGMKSISSRIEAFQSAELTEIEIIINNNSDDPNFPGTKVVIRLQKIKKWITQPSL